MAQAGEETKVITLGGKGTPLSSSAVYAVATGSGQVRVDSSALERLSNTESGSANPQLVSIPSSIFEIHDLVEYRASLVLLLSHLLRQTGVRACLPNLIVDVLNANDHAMADQLKQLDVTVDECDAVEKSGAQLYAICALVDYNCAALGTIVGAVAALSSEAVKANLTAVFDVHDKGDGFANKDHIGVASDLKVLLNGSKLVGKVECEAFSGIPVVIGNFRETAKMIHSKVRVELNSPTVGNRTTMAKAASLLIDSLVFSLKDLGENSVVRLKMNLDAVEDHRCKNELINMFEKKCPETDIFKAQCKTVCDYFFNEDFENFVKAVQELLITVWNIVALEGISALFVIEGENLVGLKSAEVIEENGEHRKGDMKPDKKKKKKVVLGKGTGQILQWIKERVMHITENLDDSVTRLQKLIEYLHLLFTPKGPDFTEFVNKVKEFLESNETRRLPKIPKGTRDFAKEQMTIREQAFSIISQVFKRHGATALDTPAFELRETLMGKYGEDSKLIYDLADQGGELCSLRYDLTVPFARYVAMNGITTFKRYQIAKVYRRDNPSKGRYREFYQCDFDIAGQFTRMGPDFEILKILTELLDELDIGDYEIKLSHRKLLDGMLEICGVPAEKFRTICSSIDKLDKQSFDQVKKEMVEEKGLSNEVADRIGSFVKEKGRPKELLLNLKQESSKLLENASSRLALEDLEILFDALDESKCIRNVVFDLSLARGLDYYTGVIFEAVFKGTTQVGSIAAGGRYDNLIGIFGTKQVPAVGVSLGIERVFAIMEQQLKERNQIARATETEVLLSIIGNESKLSLAARLVNALWQEKVKAEYEISTRFSKHIDRARDSKIPWMVLVGDKEVEKGIVKLKNLETTMEEEVPVISFALELKKRLNK